MKSATRKATFIIRLWTDNKTIDDEVWRGTAEHIGSGQPRHFQTLDEFIYWLRQELAKTGEKLES